MDLIQKNILIVGLGRSGIAAARFAKNRGASVTVTDIADEETLSSYALLARKMGVKLELGRHTIETFEHADLIVVSPGVPHAIDPLNRARKKGIPLLGELEFASRHIREPVIAISGTNGKTTTTRLLGDMLKNSGLKVFVGGNIGNPLIDYADHGPTADVVVVEISSFQLDTIDTFRPRVSVLLNISADHLDRYPDFDSYADSKARIFKNQKKGDATVLNGADPIVCSISKEVQCRKLSFYHENGFDEKNGEGAVIRHKEKPDISGISIYTKEVPRGFLDLSALKLQGRHNVENAAAASLAALAAGGTLEGIQSALNDFQGLSHRLEYITTLNEVQFFDDSKGTNIDAVAKALEVFTAPIVLIMGGRDKGGNFKSLRKLMQKHTKKLIVMGEAGNVIRSALEDVCEMGSESASTMEDAVGLAYRSSRPGDVVLLSPGCSSFDMYSDYAARGEAFCKAVQHLKNH